MEKCFGSPKIFFHQIYLHLIYVLKIDKCKYLWKETSKSDGIIFLDSRNIFPYEKAMKKKNEKKIFRSICQLFWQFSPSAVSPKFVSQFYYFLSWNWLTIFTFWQKHRNPLELSNENFEEKKNLSPTFVFRFLQPQMDLCQLLTQIVKGTIHILRWQDFWFFWPLPLQ